MAKEVISKIEKEEAEFENLVKSEEQKLKSDLDEFKFKMNEKIKLERENNLNFYNKVVEEFKVCINKKTNDFKSRVEAKCSEMETNLKKDVSKAVETIISKFLSM